MIGSVDLDHVKAAVVSTRHVLNVECVKGQSNAVAGGEGIDLRFYVVENDVEDAVHVRRVSESGGGDLKSSVILYRSG